MQTLPPISPLLKRLSPPSFAQCPFFVCDALKWDADRDLEDLGMKGEIPVFPSSNSSLPAPGKPLPASGVLFCTYSLLVAQSRKEGMSRYAQIKGWLAGAGPGGALMVFDESHKARAELSWEKEGRGQAERC